MKKNKNKEEYKNIKNDFNNFDHLKEKLVSKTNDSRNNSSSKLTVNSKKIVCNKSVISNSQLKKDIHLRLSRNVRWFIFCVLVFVTIMINMDHGTIPAATEEIITSLDLKTDDLGVFGSLVFLGNIIGIYFIFY